VSEVHVTVDFAEIPWEERALALYDAGKSAGLPLVALGFSASAGLVKLYVGQTEYYAISSRFLNADKFEMDFRVPKGVG
jgi:hypothetical protein